MIFATRETLYRVTGFNTCFASCCVLSPPPRRISALIEATKQLSLCQTREYLNLLLILDARNPVPAAPHDLPPPAQLSRWERCWACFLRHGACMLDRSRSFLELVRRGCPRDAMVSLLFRARCERAVLVLSGGSSRAGIRRMHNAHAENLGERRRRLLLQVNPSPRSVS